MVLNVATKKSIRRTSSSHTAMSVVMILLLVFLPLGSSSSSIISSTDKISESGTIIDSSEKQSNIMPCHSSDFGIAHSDQGSSNGDCCNQSDIHIQCDNCVHSCTFVKHFSSTVDSVIADYFSPQLIIKSVGLISTQFPVPPFRPPAA